MIIRRILATFALVAASVTGVAATASADNGAAAVGTAVGSPGILSGNAIPIAINIPIAICGNTVDIIAALDPAIGNVCIVG
ncbi:MAG: chaplin [Catenulispora sp.]|nr:chaplin [Catenulispora sp.]